MAERLDDDIIEFLLANPDEMTRLRTRMNAASARVFRDLLNSMKPKVDVKMVPCGTYGCTTLKPENRVFCDSCYQDYIEDPDAYK